MSIIKDFINKSRIKSPWIVHFDCGSCNGCDIETLAVLTPLYDVERFGIINVGNPKHADVLLVTGTVNYRNQHVLKTIYEQMPHPKAVVAIGACGLSGGVFRDCYNVVGGVDRVIPVDVYVPGCPPKPESIIDGVVLGLEKFAAKARGEDVSRFETRRPFDKKQAEQGAVNVQTTATQKG
ncbi:MAG: NADH-quinone oxidoreductase subunit B family protein [Desulfocurvibacter africanus]